MATPVPSVTFTSRVEPPEPMRGLEVPAELVAALGSGKRPPVKITINGHAWRSRIAIMRGRCLIGLSKANRSSAAIETGDSVEVLLELDTEPREVLAPPDLAAALAARPAAEAAYNRLSHSHKRAHVHSIEAAKRSETRVRRIERTIEALEAA
jgi:hypothetical protein